MCPLQRSLLKLVLYRAASAFTSKSQSVPRYSKYHVQVCRDHPYGLRGQKWSTFRHRNFLKIAGAHDIRWFEPTRTSFGPSKAPAWVRFGGERGDRRHLSYSVRVWVERRKHGSGPSATTLGHLSTPSQGCSAPMLCSAGSRSSINAFGIFESRVSI